MTNFVVVAVSPVKKVGVCYADLACPQVLMNFHFLAPKSLDQDFVGPLDHCVDDGSIKARNGTRTRYRVLFAHCHADFGLQMFDLRGHWYDALRQLQNQHSYLIDLLAFLSSIAPYLVKASFVVSCVAHYYFRYSTC